MRLVDGHLALNQKMRDHLSGIYSEFNVGKPTGISLVEKGNINCSLIVCVHHANWPVAKQVVQF